MTKSDLLRKSIIKLKLQCFFLMSSENVKSFFIFGGKGDTYKNKKIHCAFYMICIFQFKNCDTNVPPQDWGLYRKKEEIWTLDILMNDHCQIFRVLSLAPHSDEKISFQFFCVLQLVSSIHFPAKPFSLGRPRPRSYFSRPSFSRDEPTEDETSLGDPSFT